MRNYVRGDQFRSSQSKHLPLADFDAGPSKDKLFGPGSRFEFISEDR